MARLQQLGARSVPVVAQGSRFVWAQNLRDLAAFLNLSDKLPDALSEDEMIRRWLAILRIAQRHIRQVPAGMLTERVIPARDRTVRMLSLHIFRIAEGHLDAVEDGWVHDPLVLEFNDGEPGLCTLEEIFGYNERVIARLERWQGRFSPSMAEDTVPTTSGPQNIRWLLERSTLHSAQHARQIEAVLERSGIRVDGALTEKELGGLPLPERLFE